MMFSGTTSGPELLVELDRAAADPLHRQLANGLRDAIRAGRLSPHTRLPSTRVLAADLGVSRRLVVDAYNQLVAEGFLLSRHGSGTRVATVDAASAPTHGPAEPTVRYDIDFLPGSPDLSSFPRHAWLRALRQGLTEIESDAFGYVAPQGLLAARVAVADYLRRARGVLAEPQNIVLCSGATQAIALLGQTLRSTPLAMENPGFWLHRMVLRHNGIEPLSVPVDDDGLDVGALASSGAEAVLATPAHQSPTGVVLSAARRTALMEWARDGHLVIEDDYDAEYRYDRAPVGALQGIAPDRVVYVGSTSKTLAPGLRIGWMVLPAHLAKAVAFSKGLADAGSSVMDQVAFTQFLSSGGYDRHLRQMRRRYQLRRNALLGALARYLPDATVLGAAAGVHLTVCFPEGYPVEELVARASRMRVRVEPLAPCYAEPSSAPAGLMLGYANLSESQIVAGVQALARAASRSVPAASATPPKANRRRCRARPRRVSPPPTPCGASSWRARRARCGCCAGRPSHAAVMPVRFLERARADPTAPEQPRHDAYHQDDGHRNANHDGDRGTHARNLIAVDARARRRGRTVTPRSYRTPLPRRAAPCWDHRRRRCGCPPDYGSERDEFVDNGIRPEIVGHPGHVATGGPR